MTDVPDAPWITNYDRYFNEFYQVVEDTDDEYEGETEYDRE